MLPKASSLFRFSLVLSSIIIASCHGFKQDSKVKEISETTEFVFPNDIVNNDQSVVPFDYSKPVQCAPNYDLASFSLEEISNLNPSFRELKLNVKASGFMPPNPDMSRAAKPSQIANIRLDICLTQDGSDVKIMRIVKAQQEIMRDIVTYDVIAVDLAAITTKVDRTGSRVIAYTVGPMHLVQKNLDLALQGEIKDFNLKIQTSESDSIFVKGVQVKDQVLIVAYKGMSNSPDTAEDNSAVAGRLVFGDAFAKSSACGAGWELGSEVYQLGTAKLEFTSCFSSNGTALAAYTRLVKRIGLKLEDSNPLLGGTKLNVKMDEAQLQKQLNTFIMHHNWCDYFLLKLPEVEYLAFNGRSSGAECMLKKTQDKMKPAQDQSASIAYKASYTGAAPLLNWGTLH